MRVITRRFLILRFFKTLSASVVHIRAKVADSECRSKGICQIEFVWVEYLDLLQQKLGLFTVRRTELA